ncbi:MAG: Protein translocase subunit SecA [Burkholderia plantarii]|nr:MAG: Protein translocase subunit SecA [Burkholderia plantarii]
MTHTDDKTLDELDGFLMSDIMSEHTMTIEMLDGYLTAIAIGPSTILPTEWLAGVWGDSEDDAPDFASYEQAEHVFALITRHFNSIVQTYETDPAQAAPLFSVSEVPGNDAEYLDAEAWANGFFQGMGLRWDDWQPLLEHEDAQEWLRPLRMLGSDEIDAEEARLIADPAERERISEQVPTAVAKIHAFWQPQREDAKQRLLTQTIRRDAPKVGRNDACSCGSGKKYKKCCGADDTEA